MLSQFWEVGYVPRLKYMGWTICWEGWIAKEKEWKWSYFSTPNDLSIIYPFLKGVSKCATKPGIGKSKCRRGWCVWSILAKETFIFPGLVTESVEKSITSEINTLILPFGRDKHYQERGINNLWTCSRSEECVPLWWRGSCWRASSQGSQHQIAGTSTAIIDVKIKYLILVQNIYTYIPSLFHMYYPHSLTVSDRKKLSCLSSKLLSWK